MLYNSIKQPLKGLTNNVYHGDVIYNRFLEILKEEEEAYMTDFKKNSSKRLSSLITELNKVTEVTPELVQSVNTAIESVSKAIAGEVIKQEIVKAVVVEQPKEEVKAVVVEQPKQEVIKEVVVNEQPKQEVIKEVVVEQPSVKVINKTTIAGEEVNVIELINEIQYTDELKLKDNSVILYGDKTPKTENGYLSFGVDDALQSITAFIPIDDQIRRLSGQNVIFKYVSVNEALALTYTTTGNTTLILPIGSKYECKTEYFHGFFYDVLADLDGKETSEDEKIIYNILAIYFDTHIKNGEMPSYSKDYIVNGSPREHQDNYDNDGFRKITATTLVLDVNAVNNQYGIRTIDIIKATKYNDVLNSRVKRIKHSKINNPQFVSTIGEYIYIGKDGKILIDILNKENTLDEYELMMLISETFGIAINVPVSSKGDTHLVENGKVNTYNYPMVIINKVKMLVKLHGRNWLRYISDKHVFKKVQPTI